MFDDRRLMKGATSSNIAESNTHLVIVLHHFVWCWAKFELCHLQCTYPTSWFFLHSNLVKKTAFWNKRVVLWQLAFWTRKVLGTFKKEAPALTTGSLIIAFGTLHSTIHDDHLCISKLCLYVYKNTKMYVLIVSLRSSKWSSSYELAWPVDCENNGYLYLT